MSLGYWTVVEKEHQRSSNQENVKRKQQVKVKQKGIKKKDISNTA